MVAFGRIAEARQQVVEAARAGAEVASVQPDAIRCPNARLGSTHPWDLSVTSGLVGNAPVNTDVSHFYPGGYVSVTVSCQVPLADLAVPGHARLHHGAGLVQGSHRPLPVGRMMTTAPPRGQSGSISAFVALLLVALIVLLGLVVDGGSALAARQAATDEAEQAARAGAGALSVQALRAGSLQLDPGAAVNAAEAFAAAAGHPGIATVSQNVVTVVIHFRVGTEVLGIVGIHSLPVSAAASAADLQGVTVGTP